MTDRNFQKPKPVVDLDELQAEVEELKLRLDRVETAIEVKLPSKTTALQRKRINRMLAARARKAQKKNRRFKGWKKK